MKLTVNTGIGRSPLMRSSLKIELGGKHNVFCTRKRTASSAGGPFLTDRLPIGHGTDQQPNGLEKVELRGAAEELLLQRRIDMPAFGDFV